MRPNLPAQIVRHNRAHLIITAILSVLLFPLQAEAAPRTYRFRFAPAQTAPGYTQALPTMPYSAQRGFGFTGRVIAVDRGGQNALQSGFCTSSTPFFFSVDLPEGSYEVRLVLGDSRGTSTTTVKAEARRLMIEKITTAPGEFRTATFTVNVRRSALKSGQQVRLKRDEIGGLDWDNRLTLEFSNDRPCVASLEITPANSTPTLYIAGDSTVCDQHSEPWCAWGQMLPRFFNAAVAVANHAESGETLTSFVSERRLAKIEETIKPGDYLFIQFGHNDQKQHGPGVGAFTTYAASLTNFINVARQHGATPVLITPMNRRTFDADGRITNSLGDYPEAVRTVARANHTALIDLNSMSKLFYEALGPEGSKKAFVQYPAGTFPGQLKPLKDNTHFNNYGAYELARCIVNGIRDNKLDLAQFLTADARPFNPAHPDPFQDFHLPASPLVPSQTPEGH